MTKTIGTLLSVAIIVMLVSCLGYTGYLLSIRQQTTLRGAESTADADIAIEKTAGQDARPERPVATTSSLATILLPVAASPASKDALEAEAEFTVNELLDAFPDDARSLHVAALLQAQIHNSGKALELWTRCIELSPKQSEYYVNLAAIALDRGDASLAVETLDQARQQGMNGEDLAHHLGIALVAAGDAERAVEIAQSTLKSSPENGPLWFILGQAQLKLGKSVEAEQSLSNAVELGVHNKACYFALFNALIRNRKQDEAQQALELYQGFQETKLSTSERYSVLSEAEARRVCIATLREAAELYSERGRVVAAEHLLLRVLALDPKNENACLSLGTLYQRSGRLHNELVIRRRLKQIAPLNLMHYLRLAKTASAAELHAEAEAAIKQAISMSPMTVTGYAAMADFLSEVGEPEKAIWYAERAVRLKPSGQGFRLLARVFRLAGREKDALRADNEASKMK